MKIVLWVVGILLTVLAATFLLAYWFTRGDYEVAETVARDPDLPRIEINNTQLHAETFGNDTSKVVVVLHGGPGNDYRALLPLSDLADQYRVVFYDQRGSGLSERVPASEITLDNFIRDLRSVIEYYAGEQKILLIGHSWGAMLGSAYIGRFPESVEKAVMVEPGFLTADLGDELMKKTNYFQPPMNMEVILQLAHIWMKSMHVSGPDDQAKMDFFVEELIYHTEMEGHPMAKYFCGEDLNNSYLPIWRMGALVSQTMQESAMDEEGKFEIDFIEGVENFKGKVLFMAGECNTLIGPAYQARQMKYFPDAYMITIKDAGHSLIGERPEESLQVIRDFFTGGRLPAN